MNNMFLSVNKKRIDNTLLAIEALKLRGGFDEVGLDEFKIIIKGLIRELENVTKDLELAKEENERLLELFTEKED